MATGRADGRALVVGGARMAVDLSQGMLELATAAVGQARLQEVSPYASDRRPVFVIPGLLGDDRAVRPLNSYLASRGFQVAPWTFGRNSGPRGETFEAHIDALATRLRPHLRKLADDSGQRVSLVGHSLGGVQARELGRRLDGEVQRIITLGAPVFGVGEQDNPVLVKVGQRLRGETSFQAMMAGHSYGHWDTASPDIPCIAVTSPIDQAVDRDRATLPYESLRSGVAPIRENVVVRSSHVGMVVNPFVQLVVADRLLADVDDWRRFDPARYMGHRPDRVVRHLFPRHRG